MTVQQILTETKKMKKQEFQDLFFRMLQIANTKYNLNIFLQNFRKQKESLQEQDLPAEKEKKTHPGIDKLLKDTGILKKDNKKPLDNFIKSKGILKNIDLSDISEEELYLQGD